MLNRSIPAIMTILLCLLLAGIVGVTTADPLDVAGAVAVCALYLGMEARWNQIKGEDDAD